MSYKTGRGAGTIHGWSTQAGKLDNDPPGQVFGARIIFWALLACVLIALAGGTRA